MKKYSSENTISRYYNPPSEVETIGRKLTDDSEDFDELSEKLNENEVIIGFYKMRSDTYNSYDVATHIHNQDRLNQIYEECLKTNDGSYISVKFFAIDKETANKNLDNKIP